MNFKEMKDRLVKDAAKKEIKDKVVKIKDELDEKHDKIVAGAVLFIGGYLCYKAGYANGMKQALKTIQDAKVYNVILNQVK